MTHKVHTFKDDALGYDDATGVAERIRSGEISAEEATATAIERANACNNALQAISSERFDNALADAKGSFEGAFAGVPFYVKDNISVKDLPTQQGSRAFVAPPSRHHDPITKQMLAQGFNILGKTDMPELGLSGSSEHADRNVCNPWDIGRTAGGSSGGSAALVAAGAVPVAHGNDGAGSIRIPASMNGLFGLKCNRNRLVISNLSKPLPLNIITDGVLSRSVRDTANFFAAAEQYYKNPKLDPIGHVTSANSKRLTIGVLRANMFGKQPDADVARVLEETVQLLTSLGHTIVEAQHPVGAEFEDTFTDYFSSLALGAAAFGKKFYGESFDPKKLNPFTRSLAKHYKSRMWKQIGSPLKFLVARHKFNKEMAKYDVVLSPTLGYVTPKLGYLNPAVEFEELLQRLTDMASFNPIYNSLGAPAMSVPLGMSECGMPIGMQFGSLYGQEKRLLELAFELEAAQPFKTIWSEDS